MAESIDTKQKRQRNSYWRRIRECRHDYLESNPNIKHIISNAGFYQYLQEKFGIKLKFDNSGNISEDFEIVDPKRYMLFLLRYPDV
jgi:hypothetical protein